MMSKLLPLLSCLLLLANSASAAGGQRTSLEDIERDYSPKLPTPKASTSAVSSPTKFGFVPQRTASSYAAVKPKYQYTQANYQVKRPQYKQQPAVQYIDQQHYLNQQPQQTVQYVSQEQLLSQQQPQQTVEYVNQQQPGQYLIQQQAQQTVEYVNQQQPGQYLIQQQPQQTVEYVNQQQPDQYISQQQYAATQQPTDYNQYENVQYVTDNSIGQQPQFYYVQQYQAPSSSVESVVDPKGLQYLYVPSYVSNSIPTNEKYSSPSITNSAAKYKSNYHSQRYSQPEILVKRQPKSLLDSYVPSRAQLQYLMQQGKY